jgi:hypothetical protein
MQRLVGQPHFFVRGWRVLGDWRVHSLSPRVAFWLWRRWLLVVCDLEISDRTQIADLLGREVRDGYCLSYTIVLLTARPCGSVPVWVAVRVLPSAEIVTFVIVVTFPFFLAVTS